MQSPDSPPSKLVHLARHSTSLPAMPPNTHTLMHRYTLTHSLLHKYSHATHTCSCRDTDIHTHTRVLTKVLQQRGGRVQSPQSTRLFLSHWKKTAKRWQGSVRVWGWWLSPTGALLHTHITEAPSRAFNVLLHETSIMASTPPRWGTLGKSRNFSEPPFSITRLLS